MAGDTADATIQVPASSAVVPHAGSWRRYSHAVELTLAEQMLLVSARPGNGRFRPRSSATFAVAGAVLMELALNRRITLRNSRIVAVEPAGEPEAPGVSPLAEEWWTAIRARERPLRAGKWVTAIEGDRIYHQLRARLCDLGVLRSERVRALGLFPQTYWTTLDPAPAIDIRGRLTEVVNGQPGDGRAVALVMLADASGLFSDLFPAVERGRRSASPAEPYLTAWADVQIGEAARAVAQGVRAAISVAQALAVAQAGSG